ncbi:hypothetical protein BASA62_009886 [Batrachochytrium salamandrivorans]|nr:hypothetical protein BASA62_009886 [Batrachochytrium salamandrivorans]
MLRTGGRLLRQRFSAGSITRRSLSTETTKDIALDGTLNATVPVVDTPSKQWLTIRPKQSQSQEVHLVDAVYRPRLEEHYYNSLLEDLIVLSYDHSSPKASLDSLKSSAEWNRSLGPHPLHDLYSVTMAQLPTLPESAQGVSSLLALKPVQHGTRKRRYRKLLYNPIDYTAVPRHILLARPPPPPPLPFSPLPSRMPVLKSIVLKIWCEAAVSNKNMLLGAIMCLQSITGVQAYPLFAETGDSSKRIRAGMPLGARVEITGTQMFGFLDKLTQCVLPRMREFEGINPVGDNSGMMKLTLPDTALGYFPDIEPHFDMYPQMFETDVMMYTTGKCDWGDLAALVWAAGAVLE